MKRRKRYMESEREKKEKEGSIEDCKVHAGRDSPSTQHSAGT